MLRSSLFALSLTAAPCVLAAPVAPAPAATPSSAAAPAPHAASPAAKAAAPRAANVDKEGVVLVEQAGRVVALGTILNGDGRIVTALSRLAPGQLFVRYANGTVEPARIGHSDASRDLALLVPRTARVQKGVKAASSVPPAAAEVVWFALGNNRALVPEQQTLAAAADVGGHSAIKLGAAPKPTELGGPLLDAKGDALAIVVSGCPASGNACDAPPIGLPVKEIRSFLKTRPPESGFALPRLGFSGVGADTGVVRGVLITTIDAKGPAAQLGLRAGTTPENADLLVAIAHTPVPSEPALRAELAKHAPGERVDLLIYGKTGFRTEYVRLGAPQLRVATPPPPPPRVHTAVPAPKTGATSSPATNSGAETGANTAAPTPQRAPTPPRAPTAPAAPRAPAPPPASSAVPK